VTVLPAAGPHGWAATLPDCSQGASRPPRPEADDPQRCHRHRQPQPLGSRGIGHLRLMPLPAAPFDILEAGFNPRSSRIPNDLRLFREEVGQDQPTVLMAWLPTGHQRASEPAARFLKTDHLSAPALASRLHGTAQRAQTPTAGFPIGSTSVHAQQWMPALLLDGCLQPAGVQATIGPHEHGPVRRNTRVQGGQQRFPVRLPGPFGMRADQLPGHRNGTAALDHPAR
jgi:hypothetical protein